MHHTVHFFYIEVTMSMEILIELQGIDTKLRDLNDLLGDLPFKVNELDQQEASIKNSLIEKKERLKQLAVETHKGEVRISEINDKLSRLKDQLFLVTNNKQYDALMHEIDHLKEERLSNESESLSFMEEKETLINSANEMKNFIRPEYCFIAEISGEPVGFSLTLPDINPVLKKMNGRIFPLGWASFYLNKNKIKLFRVVALGVMPTYRRLGIDAALYYETYKKFVEKKIKWCDMSWVLEDNKGMLDSIYRLGGTIYKRHRIYEHNILS